MASSLPPGLPAAPNPLTPLAWLPPDIAFQFEIERFLVACVTGVSPGVNVKDCAFLIIFSGTVRLGCVMLL